MPLPSISQFLIESSICLLVFYGFYALVLRQETFFQLNRFYLLLTPLLSIVLPLVHLEVQATQAEEVLDPWALALLAGSEGIPQTLERPLADQFTVGDALVYIYLTGLTLMLLRLGVALYGLLGLLRSRRRTLRGPAASFFGHILHHKDTAGDERELLDAHEQVHARQWHSLDVLFLELLIAGYWFHPLIYGFRRQLKLIHEFIADALVVRRTGTRYAYARLLVRYSTARRDHPMLNTFASFTKKRLLMLKQQHSPAYRKIKYLLALPLFMGLAALFSFDLIDDLPVTVQQPLTVATQSMERMAQKPITEEKAAVSTEAITSKRQLSTNSGYQFDEIVVVAHQAASPQEPTIDLREIVVTAWHPSPLLADTIPDKQGKSKDLPAYQSIESAKEKADAQLSATEETKVSTNGGIAIRNQRTNEPPLYVIDGTPYPADGEARLEDLDPRDIASVNVYKGEKALNLYGEDGANGVVEVWTKAGAAAQKETQTIEKQEGMIVSGLPKEGVVIVIDGEEFFSPEATQVKELDPENIDYVNVYKGEKAREKYGDKARNGVIEITTKSGASAKNEVYSIGSEERMLVHDFPQENVVFVVDEEEFPSVAATRVVSIAPESVKAITRLEGPAAQKLYGKQARNGAIVITTKSGASQEKKGNGFLSGLGEDPEPLFILDGEELPSKNEPILQQVDPNDIDRINVYKGEQAIEKFGKKGRHGVVEIFTKGYDRQEQRAEKKKKKGIRVTVLPPKKEETVPATIAWEETETNGDTPGKNLNLQAFPNPANDVMTVSFNVPNATDRVNLALYDMDGRLLRVLQEGSFPAGVQRFTIGEGLNLTSGGTFILRLAVGEQVQTQRVVFQ